MPSELKDRIKKIRKEENLTQEEFGKKLTISRSQIACYERGIHNIPERVLNQIEKEFNINKEWLRTGIGEMRSISNDELELAETLATLTTSDNPLLKELASKIVKLDIEHLESINNLVDLLIKKEQV